MASSEYLINHDFAVSYGPMDDAAGNFFLPALERSIGYDRTIGFFSAKSLAKIAQGVEALVKNGGSIRLLAGAPPVEFTKDAFMSDRTTTDEMENRLIAAIAVVEPWMHNGLTTLGRMLRHKTLSIRIMVPQQRRYLSDTAPIEAYCRPSMGIFSDKEGNELGFYGTLDELGNTDGVYFDNLLVYRSWEPGAVYLNLLKQHFNRLWEGKEPGWSCLSLPETVVTRLISFFSSNVRTLGKSEEVSEVKYELDAEKREKIISQFQRDMHFFPALVSQNAGGQDGVKGVEFQAVIAQSENPQLCGVPLVRWATDTPAPLVVYYHLRDDRAEPLNSPEDLEVVFCGRPLQAGPSVAAEISAAEHFQAMLKASADSRKETQMTGLKTKQRALIETAHRILAKAAICDLAKIKHATLFDEDILKADFDEATVLRQTKKGSPFPELLDMTKNDRPQPPSANDPFYLEVEGKSPKKIQAIEASLMREGRELVKKWTELCDVAIPEESHSQVFVCKYYAAGQKEKSRLSLVIAPPHKERFTRYLPFYSMETALDHFVRRRRTAEDGWIVADTAKKISKSMFVMRIEGRAMEPLISQGSFAVFDSDIKGSHEGAVILAYGRDIHDPDLSSPMTVRRFRVLKAARTDGDYTEVALEALHADYPRVILNRLEDDAFRIIARFVGLL